MKYFQPIAIGLCATAMLMTYGTTALSQQSPDRLSGEVANEPESPTGVHVAGGEFVPENTQPTGESPLDPQEAVKRLRVRDGFQVTLAAAEPDVQQPIAITYDDRGRLWVAESYSYNGSKFTDAPHDRILIFEDTTGDGVLDRRTVFRDGLTHLTGLEIGFGGVWFTAPPHLSFISDHNRDDVPDAEPIVHLEGWSLDAEHNSVNGLNWGPDGWLYGRHGIKQPSLVGRPGTSKDNRVELSCCIWRYHPTEHQFEVVADGTINPWGLDFDEHGQGFMTTSVVEHLWHLVPGAHYERWKDRGTHPDPHAYELMTATCDHLHWASGAFGKESRVAEGNQNHGGGHSHCDAMIYLGDRWPAKYRGALLMSNIHGRRVNCDRLLLDANGYRGVHDEDFLIADDPWFRAVSMEYGPDGDVYLTDWSDSGECHDRDGVHRTSGRIYKISWGAPIRVSTDLTNASNEQLVDYQLHRNEWFVRHARRILQERTAAGQQMSLIHQQLRKIFADSDSVSHKLRAMWTLYCTGGVNDDWLIQALDHSSEHVRAWAIRLLMNVDELSSETMAEIEQVAARERSWLVRLSLVAMMQKVPIGSRWTSLMRIATQSDGWQSANLQRMIWYAMEPEAAKEPKRALDRIADVAPAVRRWIARRVTEERHGMELLFDALARTRQAEVIVDLLSGLNQSPESEPLSHKAAEIVEQLIRHEHAEVRLAAVTVGARAGDGIMLLNLRVLLHDESSESETAQAVLSGLVRRQANGLVDDVQKLIASRRLVVPALLAAGGIKNAKLAELVLQQYPAFNDAERTAAIDFLISHRAGAQRLLAAIETKVIPASEVSAQQARQIVAFDDAALSERLELLWGNVRPSPVERLKRIYSWEQKLTPLVLKQADIVNGRALFNQTCGSCHKLFGDGNTIGPDLTGANRRNLHYLLSNVIDPSASVPADFRLAIVLTADGRVVTGMVTDRSQTGLTIRTTGESLRIADDDTVEFKLLKTSMMPDGLLDKLSDEQVRDLIAWLMNDETLSE